MSRCSQPAIFAALAMLWCGVSASAETLRCQSVNGNLNCAGSGGVSCQTVDGKKVCTSGHGDVVQSFGGGSPAGHAVNPNQRPSEALGDEGLGESQDGDEGADAAPIDPALKERLEHRDPTGRTLRLQRDGSSLHLRSNWLAIDRD